MSELPDMTSTREGAARARLRERLTRAYVTALKAGHECGSVQICVGLDVYTSLKKMANVEDDTTPGRPQWTMWGLPLILDRSASPDHISVHVVQAIW